MMFGDSLAPAPHAITIDDDGHIGQTRPQQLHFIVSAVGGRFVAPAQNRRPVAALPQISAQPDNHRRLAGPAGGDIADGNHRPLQMKNVRRTAVVTAITLLHPPPVNSRRTAQRAAQYHRNHPFGLTAHDRPDVHLAGVSRQYYRGLNFFQDVPDESHSSYKAQSCQ